MVKNVVSKVVWVGRATVFLVGLAVILALVVGFASTAFAAKDDKSSAVLKDVADQAITAVTGLKGSVIGPILRIDNDAGGTDATALDLQVEPGKSPMTVDSDTKVANLNADKLDGQSVEQMGVNGIERVRVQSTFDSTAHKSAHAQCPAGKVVIGGGAQVFPSNADPNTDRAPIVIRYSYPDELGQTWVVIADEIQDYGFEWWVSSTAICARAGTP